MAKMAEAEAERERAAAAASSPEGVVTTICDCSVTHNFIVIAYQQRFG